MSCNIKLTDLELRLVINALKIWRGDFPITDEYPNNKPAYPTLIWAKEVNELTERLLAEQVLKGGKGK